MVPYPCRGASAGDALRESGGNATARGASWIFQWRLLETLIRRRRPPRIARPQSGEDREEVVARLGELHEDGCLRCRRAAFLSTTSGPFGSSIARRAARQGVGLSCNPVCIATLDSGQRARGRQASDRQCAIPDGAPDSCRGGVALIRSRDTRFAWVLTAGIAIAVGGRIHLDLSRCGRHPERCRRHRHRALPRGRRPAGYPGPDRQPGSTRPPPTTGPTHCSRRSGSSSSSRGAPKRCFSATRRRPGPRY